MGGFDPFVIRQLLGPTAAPMDQLLAAPTAGHSFQQFRGSNDEMMGRFYSNPNLPEATRQKALEEIKIRQRFGTWGIPGSNPVPPQLG